MAILQVSGKNNVKLCYLNKNVKPKPARLEREDPKIITAPGFPRSFRSQTERNSSGISTKRDSSSATIASFGFEEGGRGIDGVVVIRR